MIQFVIGFILGIFIATVGVTGVLTAADKSVDVVKMHSKQISR